MLRLGLLKVGKSIQMLVLSEETRLGLKIIMLALLTAHT